jgi:hypothetical protein
MADEKSAPEEFVVLASFHDRRDAERLVASLRHKFRAVVRKGHASALVISANPDSSVKVTQSRVVTSSDVTSTLIRLPVAWTVGFFGIFSGLQGKKSASRAGHSREGHADQTRMRLMPSWPRLVPTPLLCWFVVVTNP